MMFLLALTSSALYGAADFLGGVASKRLSTTVVVAISQATGLAVLLVAVSLLPRADPAGADFAYGAAAGLAGTIGVGLLYRALAIGVMAVVAPTTAVCAVAIPVLAAIAFGERPGLATIGGIALAIAAIVLVSQSSVPVRDAPARHTSASAFSLAVIAGIAIGFFFLALARTSDEAGLWPLVAARGVSVGLFAAIARLTSKPLRIPMGILGTVAAGGILDMLANLLYLIATRSGPLSVVVTLASLYPASTVFLARIVLHERLNTRQWIGVVCAMVAVAMIVR